MSWKDILKVDNNEPAPNKDLYEKISWPNELIGVYDSNGPTHKWGHPKDFLVVEKSEIPSYLSREGWKEIKLTHTGEVDKYGRDGEVRGIYSYSPRSGGLMITKKEAVMNALGKQEWEKKRKLVGL